MRDLTYVELIAADLFEIKCCVCDFVIEYKDAERKLVLGDLVISHTYCPSCLLQVIKEMEG